jgi:integrase
MADVYRRCGCRDASGKTLGAKCPQLKDPKHGTWAFYLAGGVDPKSGKRRQIRKGGFSTKTEAQKARNASAVKLDQGTYVTPTKQTYADYVDSWFKSRLVTGNGLKPTTADNYRRYIENDIKPSHLGRLKLTDIRRFHVNAFVDELTAAGRGATTVRRIAAVVQGSLRAAAADDLIESNPSSGIKLPKVAERELEIWEPAQVGAFLDVAAGHRLGALFETAMFTGLRRAEVIGLRWSDIDMSRRVLTIRNTRTQAGKSIAEGSPKTAAGRRVLDVDDVVVGALVAWKLRQAQEADEWGSAWVRSGYVFTYENGEPLKPQYATRLFEKLRKAAKLPSMTFHGQRHENASLMIASGTDIAVVAKRLGHSSLQITSDIYGHLIGSASRDAAERSAALVPRSKVGAHTLHTRADSADMEEAPEHATSA